MQLQTGALEHVQATLQALVQQAADLLATKHDR
jgi:hypothetical protein